MNEVLCAELKSVDSKMAYCKPEVVLLSNLSQTEASKKMLGTENTMGMDGNGPS